MTYYNRTRRGRTLTWRLQLRRIMRDFAASIRAIGRAMLSPLRRSDMVRAR